MSPADLNKGARSPEEATMALSSRDGEDLVVAGAVLAAHGLVTAFGHVSTRHCGGVLITPAGPLRNLDPSGCVPIPVDADYLPPGAPLESWLHLAIYSARPDVGAVCRAQPDDLTALAAAGVRLAPITGHAVVAGAPVPVSPDGVLARSPDTAARAAAALGSGTSLVLKGNGAVAVAGTVGRAVARMWLLGRTARALAIAAGAGEPQDLTDDEAASWRAASDELLDRVWTYLTTPAHHLSEAL